ncbi:MAG: hypothetical protein JXA10_13725 [Anaerolineae bacterium]|nr:hypothetical protein [Anaerolineae bacterium]
MINSRERRLAQWPDPEQVIDSLKDDIKLTLSDIANELPDDLVLPAVREKRDRVRTFTALNAAHQHALRIPDYDLMRDRYVILSDTHKGARKRGSDEFKQNEHIYCDALDYYLRHDYRLILNGDVEEGWKASYDAILAAYADTAYKRERAFADRGDEYYIRTYGNHDVDWADPTLVEKYLNPFFERQIQVHPAVMLGDKIFITHGHQGDFQSDRLIWLARRVVRYLWNPLQRLFAIQMQRAAVNGWIRTRRDQLLSAWAKAQHTLIIAGHTHRPILQLDEHPGTEIPTPDNLENLDPDARLHYVNDGCCVHKRAITGVEIDRGEIRLIRWQDRANNTLARLTRLAERSIKQTAERIVFQQNDLGALLARL